MLMTRDVPSLDAIEAILFDLDGTLVETSNRWGEMIARQLLFLKRPFPRVNTEKLGRQMVAAIEMPGNYVVSFIERIGLSGSIQGIADRMRRSKGLATRANSSLIPGSLRLLEELAGRYRMAVVTTRARPEAVAFVRNMGMERYFPVVISRGDVWRMKPHPAPVRRAAQLLGVPPERCIMVGDTTMDIRAGRGAGAYAVGVLSGYGLREELESAGAHLVLERAEQLLEYLPNDAGDG
jgi:HAD superfamily hydrolase (TIGR01509 family)